MTLIIDPIALRLFGGISLDQITGKDVSITFNDIAGIDQVKQEIIELVEFLRNPQRFLDLGARSPAGVLLVGPPGTGTPQNLIRFQQVQSYHSDRDSHVGCVRLG